MPNCAPETLKGLIDSTPNVAVLINLLDYYTQRALPEKGEILVNGEWKPVKAGDVHVCPRGIAHDTRALEENLQYLSIFTPHLPAGTDINWLK